MPWRRAAVRCILPNGMPDPTPSPDFTLKPPADTAPPAAPAPGSVPTTPTPGTSAGAPISAAALPGAPGLDGTDAVAGVAILLALAAAFLFLRGAVRGHLIGARASPSAAGNAGWALFSFLMALAVLIVFGLLGSLWQVAAFTVPLLLLVLVTLVLFVLLYRSAARGRPRSRPR